jgi:serine/threonine protein kinase
MTHVTAAEGRPVGLGRYRFRETLSTSFFGPRYRVDYEGTPANSDAPPSAHADPARSSSHARADMPLALRLIEVDAPHLLERLARAVQAVREVDHRSVLRPVQIVRASTRLGIVTPNVEGVTLAKLLADVSAREEQVPPSIALRIISDVLNGLQALSDHGPAGRRRDWGYGGVTPDSIHVGLDGQTRYLDPGVASAAARQPCWSHEASALAYTAPEQTGADANFDATSDNFSVGVMLWELLTCRPLFGASTAAETLERIHLAPIPRVQRQLFVRGEPIVFALAQAVSQALRRDPKVRFNSYDEFANALDSAGEPASRARVSELVHRSLPEPGKRVSEAPRALPTTARHSLPPAPVEPLPIAPAPLPAASVRALHVAGTELTTEQLPQPANDAYWPASAAWVPESSETHTAFPIGDLSSRPRAVRRSTWQVALACAAAVGLGLFGWQMIGHSATSRSAATSAPPPVAAPATAPLETPHAPPLAAAEPTAAEPAAATLHESELAPASIDTPNTPAGSAREPARRAAKPLAPRHAPPRPKSVAAPAVAKPAPFIPSDI